MRNVSIFIQAETSSNIVEDSKDADSENSLQKLSKEYGQSTVENSLYHIFESFQEMGLMPAWVSLANI